MIAAAQVLHCRFCGCTHETPCVLPDGDACMLCTPTSLCNNPRCIVAAAAEARRMGQRRREETASLVRPVRESWRRQWETDREKRRRARKQAKKHPRRAA